MQAIVFQKKWLEWALVGLAATMLSLSALVRIPGYPVPFTLQELVLFVIALRMTPQLALLSVIGYLGIHTAVYPLWVVGPNAGYLVAFPIAAYVISRLSRIWHPLLAILCGEVLIYGLGFAWLSSFIGPSAAFWNGVIVFLAPACLKAWIAYKLS